MGAGAGDEAAETKEVGATGNDLLLWRAREALRNAELRLGVQAQAMQALETRATSMMGWCVTVGLALGAAATSQVYGMAATIAAICLIIAALQCMLGLMWRDWTGPGFRPLELLNDHSPSEYYAIVRSAKSYQVIVEQNSNSFHRFRQQLNFSLF